MLKSLSVLALLAALCPLATAQSVSSVVPVPLSAGPVHAGVYDVASGVFFPGTPTPPPAGPEVVYDNSAFAGSFFPAGPGLVSMDWGTLAAGGHNDITEIEIGYATSSTAPVDLTVYLHQGATGFGVAGAPITAIALSGLPGSVSGGAEAFAITVTLAAPIKLLDGAIGYSYEAFDTVTGPLLVGPPNEAGVIDAFDQYTSGVAAYVGTFFFGGVPLASFYMGMTGVEPECFLVAGPNLGNTIFTPGSFGFATGLAAVNESYAVLMDDYPSFTVPKSGAALGQGGILGGGASGSTAGNLKLPSFVGPNGEFAVQIMMWNPVNVPANPEQYSPVLVGRIMPNGQVFARPVGAGDIDISIEVTTNAQGETVFSFPFAVDM